MLSVLLGFLGYSLLNVSQATQKIGLLRMREKRLPGRLLWLLATVGTLASSFLVFAGVALGSASLVGAMAGAGLATLAVFSHFVMKEKVGIKELLGVIVIVLAAGVIGFFAEDPEKTKVLISPPIRLDYLFILLAAITVLAGGAWFAVRKKSGAAGIVIGVFSGSLGGLVPLFQKVSTSAVGKSMSLFPSPDSGGGALGAILSMFSNPFTLIWILLSMASMLVLQFAYKKAEVIRIIPFFSSSCIVIPVLGGIACLGERLHALQWSGVALILAGLLLLTLKGKKSAAESQTPAQGK